jgi:hypothetical protein
MKRVFSFLLFSIVLLTILPILLPINAVSPFPTPAARRYATCDVCGFCVTGQDPSGWLTPAPRDWANCQACLYPSAYPTGSVPDPRAGNTLLVDPETNAPPKPAEGRHFTILGCVKTQLNDFTQTGAASSLIQMLLNVIFATAGGVAILYIIYGSFLVMTSQGDPERLAYGKRVIVGSIVGLILVLTSIMLVNLVAKGILRLPGFSDAPPPIQNP